jgi:predicted nucleic acid-binding protein
VTSSHSPHVTFFLDANVLISAAWKANAEVAGIWQFDRVRLVTATYVMGEVLRNLPHQAQIERLRGLMTSVEVLTLPEGLLDSAEIAELLMLPEKDRPVLAAAIQAQADYLITGDKKHFSQWFGTTVRGVRIEPPTHLPSIFPNRRP